jgi:hypothetical protein
MTFIADSVIFQHYHDNIDTFYVYDYEYKPVLMPLNLGADNIDTFYVDTTLVPWETTYITIEPFSQYNHSWIPINWGDTLVYYLDKFTTNAEDLPSLEGTKWHYKGWIMSPFIDDVIALDCDSIGKMTKPAWAKVPTASVFNQVFPNSDNYRIITTGSFKDFNWADDGNPYSDSLRIPNFPGEDFLMNLPCADPGDRLTLADPSTGDTIGVGDIFVTIEPDGYEAPTNFPFFIYATTYAQWHPPNSPYPNNPSATPTIPPYSRLIDFDPGDTQSFFLQLLSGNVRDNPLGFPRMEVKIVRE